MEFCRIPHSPLLLFGAGTIFRACADVWFKAVALCDTPSSTVCTCATAESVIIRHAGMPLRDRNCLSFGVIITPIKYLWTRCGGVLSPMGARTRLEDASQLMP